MSAIDRQRGNSATTGGFRLGRERGKFMGVCAGLADHFGFDVTLVRLGFVLGTVFGFGSLLIVYLAIGLIAD